MQNIQVLHLWQLDLTILTAQISRSSVERTGVCGCQSTFTALIASDSNSKHTHKTLTDFGLTGTSLRHSNRHLKTLWDGRKKWHAIVRSRTVTWLTRWRLPQWNQLNPGIFFLTNAMRKHATMLAGTNSDTRFLGLELGWDRTWVDVRCTTWDLDVFEIVPGRIWDWIFGT